LPALPQADLPTRSPPLYDRHSRRSGAVRRPPRACQPAAAPATRGAARLSPEPVMADPRHEAVRAHLRRSTDVIERVSADGKFTAAGVVIAERIAASLKSGGKILLAGNGGSAADAQHIAAE